MSKASQISTASTLFRNTSHVIGKKKGVFLEDPKNWANIFFQEITSKIDEEPFFELFSKKGRKNAPIRQLIGMLVLKDGKGWTDRQLQEECSYNLMVMRSLGLMNLEDEAPCASTYYSFKERIYKHWANTGEDLLLKCFGNLTKKQRIRYDVSGKAVRMDSKLISSNIRSCSRLQLFISVLQKYWKTKTKAKSDLSHLIDSDQEMLLELSGAPASRLTFDMSREDKKQLLIKLSELVVRIVESDSSNDKGIQLVQRLAEEQITIDEETGVIELEKQKGLKGSSLQSPHDEEATFRKKGNQRVTGYSGNITETCDKGELNLIVDVIVEPASQNDQGFFQPAIEAANEVLDGSIEEVYNDGGYASEPNREFAKDKLEDWHVTGASGKKRRFLLDKGEDELVVTDNNSGEKHIATERKNHKGETMYRILIEKTFRYFTEKEIESYERYLKIINIPAEIKNIRANVESTIHQTFYGLDGNKSSYRGLHAHKSLATSRSIWVNYRRIADMKQGKGRWKAIFDYFYAMFLYCVSHTQNEIYSLRINFDFKVGQI